MRRAIGVALVLGAAVAVGVVAAAHQTASSPPAPTASSPSTTAGKAGRCVVRVVAGQYEPDRACTPGATNPAVTQATIGSTICARGWATAQRHTLFPLAVSERVKAVSVREYGAYAGTSLRGYELDHLTPVELAGLVPGTTAAHPNLWVESPPSRNLKDKVEAALNRWVCSGRLLLARAQEMVAADWVQAGVTIGVVRVVAGRAVEQAGGE